MITTILSISATILVQVTPIPFGVAVSDAAKNELHIVERLKSLRSATERLPENWQATGVKSAHEGILTKPMLLTEIENMELMAAERWTIILENTARITGSKEVKRLSLQGKASSEEMLANHFRNQLAKIPKIHSDIHQRLDEYNAKLKDGILMNLASKLIPNAN